MSSTGVLAEINHLHGTRFAFHARPPGGVNDVWIVAEPDGRRAILKLNASTLADLQTAAPEVASRYEQFVGRVELPGGDYVHGDLHFGNVLVQEGRVGAIIDIESGGSGTRAIDYGRLLRDAYFPHRVPEDGVRELILQAGEAVAGPEVLAVCAGAAALDNLRWRVHCRPEMVAALIPAFLRLADDLERRVNPLRGAPPAP